MVEWVNILTWSCFLFINWICSISSTPIQNRFRSNWGFPKIDHSGSSARIVLEQNKFSKSYLWPWDCSSCFYSLMTSQLNLFGSNTILAELPEWSILGKTRMNRTKCSSQVRELLRHNFGEKNEFLFILN